MISLTMLSAVIMTAGAAEDILSYHADFEAPDFVPGNIGGQRGWTVDQGKAEVTAGAGRGGSAGLVLLPSEPFSQARLRLEAPAEPAGRVSFVDLYVRPVAGAADHREEIIDVNSARIGLFRTEDPKSAAVWVFDGDREDGKGWLETAARLPVDEKTGHCPDWHRLTLREDTARQIWDVWVDGVWAAANVGFEEPRQAGEATYIFMGDRTDPIALDDLAISAGNPLGQDTDSDGLPDDLEKALGFNPLLDDRDADAAGTGESNLARWAASGGAGKPLIAEPELPAVLTLSRSSALVDGPFEVVVELKGEAAEIRYTLDGSEPAAAHGQTLAADKKGAVSITQSGVLRVAALSKKGRITGKVSAAWLFPADVARFVRPEGFPSRLPASTGPVPLRYGPATGAAPDPEAVRASLLAAPIVVLAAPEATFFDVDRGFYARSESPLKAEVEVMLLRAGGTAAGPVLTATASLSGESSLSHTTTPKHSFRIRLQGEAAALKDLPLEREFVLRHPTQDSWVRAGDPAPRREALYFSDALASATLGSAGHPTLPHRFVHVFLNGAYWGVYDAVGQAPGGAESTLLKGEKSGTVSAICGGSARWEETMRRLSALAGFASQGVPEIQGWEAAAAALDQDNLIDYILTNIWLRNRDWPVKNFLITQADPASPFQFLSWDAEESLRAPAEGEADIFSRIQEAPDGPAAAFTRLSAWPLFRQRVLERAKRLFTEGALSPDAARGAIASQTEAFRPLAPLEAARWSSQYDPWDSGVLPAWEKRVESLKAYTEAEGTRVTTRLEAWAALRDRIDAGAALRYARSQERAKNAPGTVNPLPLQVTDADGDGLPDAWEKAHGLDPGNPADAAADSDGDGFCNRDEFALGLDPRSKDDPAAHLPPPETSVFTRMNVLTIRRGQAVKALWQELPELPQPPKLPGSAK